MALIMAHLALSPEGSLLPTVATTLVADRREKWEPVARVDFCPVGTSENSPAIYRWDGL
jgi:hypothetical protein